jgi:hypothetical protein
MQRDGVVVDSAMPRAEALAGSSAPAEVLASLSLLEVRYLGFDGLTHAGQLVVHRELAPEIRELFGLLMACGFPVRQAVPVVRFGWSDAASMAADNSSAFNHRVVTGTDRLSRHAAGRALDLNPFENPVLYPDGRGEPPGAVYRPDAPGTLCSGDQVVTAFKERGWRWGGEFSHLRDYHHFEKG